MLTSSVGYRFRQGTVGTAGLCSGMSEVSAENNQTQWPEPSGAVFTLGVDAGCHLGPQLEPPTECLFEASPDNLFVRVWAPSKHGGWAPREQEGNVWCFYDLASEDTASFLPNPVGHKGLPRFKRKKTKTSPLGRKSKSQCNM